MIVNKFIYQARVCVINLYSVNIILYLIMYSCNLSGVCAELKQVFVDKLIFKLIHLLALFHLGAYSSFISSCTSTIVVMVGQANQTWFTKFWYNTSSLFLHPLFLCGQVQVSVMLCMQSQS